jgi:hypothetical protein
VIFNIPENIKIDFVPKNIDLKTEFGTYRSFVKVNGNQIIYSREQTMFKNHYPAEKFNSLVAFYKEIYRADKQKAVLVKK